MLFYSVEFIVFLVLVFALYWVVKGRNAQNLVLCLSGALFYGYADVAMLLPLICSAAVNYFLGIRIAGGGTERMRQVWLYAGVAFNIGILCYFKYFGFFYGAIS